MIKVFLWSPYLDLSSACVKDTLGHMSTPVFSFDCCLLCIFPCHANWLQISRYGVNPVRSRPSGSSSGVWVHLPSCGLLWYPVVFNGVKNNNHGAENCLLEGKLLSGTLTRPQLTRLGERDVSKGSTPSECSAVPNI